MKKINILIVIYIILIVTELFFYVPYHHIQIFKSQQNVPHTEIIGSGYSTMDNIKNDNAYIQNHEKTSAGKIVNTPQVFINVSLTTVLAVGLFFLFQKREKKTIEDTLPIPFLDINSLAFATEEEIEQAQRDYARQMAEYVRRI